MRSLPKIAKRVLGIGAGQSPGAGKGDAKEAAVEPRRAVRSLLALSERELSEALTGVPWEGVERLFEVSERVLLANANWRRSPPRIIRHFQRTAVNLDAADVVGRHVLDFGCGHSNPLAAALLFHLNGAARVTATDLKATRDEAVAAGLYYLAKACALHPGEFSFWGTSPEVLLERLRQIDMAALRAGEWRAALGDVPIRHVRTTAEEYAKEIGAVDLVISQSVLEHVSPFVSVMQHLADLMSEGGKMVNYVDFNDHDRRSNAKDPAARWRFLTTNETRGASHSNRIRVSEMVRLIDGCGFRTSVTDSQKTSPPASLRGRLLEPFKDLSDDDLAVTSAMLVSLRTK